MRWTIATATVSLALVASCGSSTATRDSDHLKAAVHSFSDAYLSGDDEEAYAMLSDRCQSQVDRDEFRAVVAAAKEMFGPTPIETLDVDVDGDDGSATYTYPDDALNQTAEPWVFEDHVWHVDDCKGRR
jgi:hypothetical protein